MGKAKPKSFIHRYFIPTVLLLAICAMVFGIQEIRTFAHEARESRKSSSKLSPAETASVSAAEPKSESTNKNNASPLPSQEIFTGATSTQISQDKDHYPSARESIHYVHKLPVIETCTWFEPEKGKLFEKFRIKPKGFEILVMNRSFEISTLSARLPKNIELILRQEEDPTFVNDLSYAALVYQANNEVAKNLERARLVDIRGYYARVLAQIVFKNPSLVGDPELISNCKAITDLSSPMNRAELNEKVIGFMQRAQVKDSEIAFDPQYMSKLVIDKRNPALWVYDIQR